MSDLPTYTYADGSANQYIITPTTLEYDPVTPEESSTGMYSGGEPKTVSITPEQFDSIQELLDKAVAKTAIHIEDRIKTSGVIVVAKGSEQTRVIIEPFCAEQQEIEALLKKIISQ